MSSTFASVSTTLPTKKSQRFLPSLSDSAYPEQTGSILGDAEARTSQRNISLSSSGVKESTEQAHQVLSDAMLRHLSLPMARKQSARRPKSRAAATVTMAPEQVIDEADSKSFRKLSISGSDKSMKPLPSFRASRSASFGFLELDPLNNMDLGAAGGDHDVNNSDEETHGEPLLPPRSTRSRRQSMAGGGSAGRKSRRQSMAGGENTNGNGILAAGSIDAEGEASDNVMLPGRKMGPGGVPQLHDKKAYLPRENDLMKIASSMGMVRKDMTDPVINRVQTAAVDKRAPSARHATRHQQPVLATAATSKVASSVALASGSSVTSQISQQGVQLSVLQRFAANVQSDSPTREVVMKSILQQTLQEKNRYIDLISDRTVSEPQYYIIHAWSMNFKTLVDTLSSYFSSCKLRPEDVYIWIDIFCVNQHKTSLSPADMRSIVEVINKSPKALLVLDEEGLLFSRAWVIFEMAQVYRAVSHAQQASSREERLIVLPASWHWKALQHPYTEMSMSKLAAFKNSEKSILIAESKHVLDKESEIVKLKEMMLLGAKQELQRCEKLASINPQRLFESATALALLNFLEKRYTQAEETMQIIRTLMDKVNSHFIRPTDEGKYFYHLASIYLEKGQIAEAMRTLQPLVSTCESLKSEMYLEGMSLMVEAQCAKKLYTKAEMMCRKLMELRLEWFGRRSPSMVENRLLMVTISSLQNLHEEANERCADAMALAVTVSGERSLLAAKCHQAMALISFMDPKRTDTRLHLDKALTIRAELLGKDHILSLESKALEAKLLKKEGKLVEAEAAFLHVLNGRLHCLGLEHHDTLESLGQLSEVKRNLNKAEEADALEKKIQQAGKNILNGKSIDLFKSLRYVSEFLLARDDLLERAAGFLTRAYLVYKDKLNPESEMIGNTRQQLEVVLERGHEVAVLTLENAQLYSKADLFLAAEGLLKRCWSISKLIRPEGDHKAIAESLADALFGQGKALEAKAILKAAGLVKKGMSDNVPASYLRWLNKRVAKYLDANGNEKGGQG